MGLIANTNKGHHQQMVIINSLLSFSHDFNPNHVIITADISSLKEEFETHFKLVVFGMRLENVK